MRMAGEAYPWAHLPWHQVALVCLLPLQPLRSLSATPSLSLIPSSATGLPQGLPHVLPSSLMENGEREVSPGASPPPCPQLLLMSPLLTSAS